MERAVQSVRAQTYPCRHYVVVDGERYHRAARDILTNYPDVSVLYLPMNTGANGWFNSHINAAVPFLIQEDIVCFLDDDNSYRPNHIQTIADCFNAQSDLDFAYSLRNFVRPNGEFVTRDEYSSLGFHMHKLESGKTYDIDFQENRIPVVYNFCNRHLIDVNCMALSLACARAVSHLWIQVGYGNDKVVTDYLLKKGKWMATGCYTVDYTINYRDVFPCFDDFAQYLSENMAKNIVEQFLMLFARQNIEAYQGKRPWAKEQS